MRQIIEGVVIFKLVRNLPCVTTDEIAFILLMEKLAHGDAKASEGNDTRGTSQYRENTENGRIKRKSVY